MLWKLANTSRLWAVLAIVLYSIGGAAGIVAMIWLDPVGEEVATFTRGDYVTVQEIITPATGCTVLNVIAAKRFSWSAEYTEDRVLPAGLVIEDVDHCNELLAAFPDRIRIDGGEFVTKKVFRPSENGASEEMQVAFARHWVKDLGRRLLALVVCVFAGMLAALPWIAIYQVTRRLEEIRDRR